MSQIVKDELDARIESVFAGRIERGMSFHEKVWALTVRVPAGKVTTYGRIAAALGSGGARAVGGALNRNPHAPRVPCHRVVGHDGRLCGFAHGLAAKRRLLEGEGVEFRGERVAGACVMDLPHSEPRP